MKSINNLDFEDLLIIRRGLAMQFRQLKQITTASPESRTPELTAYWEDQFARTEKLFIQVITTINEQINGTQILTELEQQTQL